MAARKKSWSELTPGQRAAVVIGGAAEAALTAWAVRDLRRRPSDAVRGPKLLWVLSFAVQPFGPVSYLLLGRRSRA